jgi:predicted Rossmann fold flavoprotein
VTATVPALVPLVLDDTMFHKTLSGLSHDVKLTTIIKRRHVDSRTGGLLWTHFGVSGPVVMDASRFWCLAQEQEETVAVYGNFLPDQTSEQAQQWFMDQAAGTPRRSLTGTLGQLVPERFAEALCLHIACDPQTAIAQLPRKVRNRLIEALTTFRFPVKEHRGWNYAEVTAGGVPLEEINYRTMESKLVPGLYLVGEILDCDGRIGGFNFQWAWATGWIAGRASAMDSTVA